MKVLRIILTYVSLLGTGILVAAKLTYWPGIPWLWAFSPALLCLAIVLIILSGLGLFIYLKRKEIQNIFKQNK